MKSDEIEKLLDEIRSEQVSMKADISDISFDQLSNCRSDKHHIITDFSFESGIKGFIKRIMYKLTSFFPIYLSSQQQLINYDYDESIKDLNSRINKVEKEIQELRDLISSLK